MTSLRITQLHFTDCTVAEFYVERLAFDVVSYGESMIVHAALWLLHAAD